MRHRGSLLALAVWLCVPLLRGQVKAWLRKHWFTAIVALWTSLVSLNGIITTWLGLGFGWGALQAAHDILHGAHP